MALLHQVVMPYTSGLPRDVAVNTFHSTFGILSPEDAAAAFSERLEAFYTEPHDGEDPIDTWLSSVISRSADNCVIRSYDLDEPMPRVPIHEHPFTLGNPGSAGSLPSEVALVLSYRASYVSGIPNARRRGRIYLGPLSTQSATSGTGEHAVPASSLIDSIRAAAVELSTAGAMGDTTWSIYSQAGAFSAPVIAGWIDNDFDTQRRRGPDPTERNPWVG